MKNYVIDTDTAIKKLGFFLGNSKDIDHYYLCEDARGEVNDDVMKFLLYPQKLFGKLKWNNKQPAIPSGLFHV